MPKPQELSPIYQEISDLKTLEDMLRGFLNCIHSHPVEFQKKWEKTVKKQFEKGVEKYGSTLDANNTKDYIAWGEEALEELVDWAAYSEKGFKSFRKGKKIKIETE